MRKPRFRGVIFDMDGTLTVPTLDFQAIRREIGIPSGDLALEIPRLPPDRRRAAWAIVEAHEERAMAEQRLQDGAAALLERCRREGLRAGVVTRNLRRSVDHLCARFNLCFDAVVTREFPHLKPHPAPILHILAGWSMTAAEALTVGDYLHDIDSGRSAGTATCFFQNLGAPFYGQQADFVVHSMTELETLLFGGGDSRSGDHIGGTVTP